METTTIQLSKDLKSKIETFGSKGESYDTILRKVYALAIKEQLKQFLLNSDTTISIEEARKDLEKEWPRSK